MSLINTVLQDLDRRQALGAAGSPSAVRPVPRAKAGGREWFWRSVAALMIVSIAWVAWVAYQLMPRQSVATDDAIRAAAQAQKKRAQAKASAPAAAPTPEPAVTAPAAAPVATAPAAPTVDPAPRPSVPRPDTLKLALELELGPLVAASPEPKGAAKAEPVAKARRVAKAAEPQGTVSKRDRSGGAAETAENHFRRAVLLLNQGRVSEAEDQLVAALVAHPPYVQARQAYVSLLLEQRRVDAARGVLQEALVLNPSQPTFALTLARIHAQQRDYLAALEVMDRAGSVARNADFQALRGVILQRLGRDAEAVEALQNAIQGGPQPGTTWVALGISLEALAKKPEAAQAYRRALDAGPLASEARAYAESRARALE